MTGDHPGLAGLRLLVVEDNFLLAELLADILRDFGCEVVGPAPDVATGRDLAQRPGLDGALLDVNLAGELCFPIAAVLAERGVPYIFVTGYDGAGMIPAEFQAVRRISKPIDPRGLARTLGECFARTSPR